MIEKFLIEFFEINEITGEFEKIGDISVDDFPSDKDIASYMESTMADRIKISKIYEQSKEKKLVFITYSDSSSESVPITSLEHSNIIEKLKEGCSVEIHRFEPSWE